MPMGDEEGGDRPQVWLESPLPFEAAAEAGVREEIGEPWNDAAAQVDAARRAQR